MWDPAPRGSETDEEDEGGVASRGGCATGSPSFATVAQEFPIKGHRCYLNNASIGALSLPVIAAVDRFMHDVRDNGRDLIREERWHCVASLPVLRVRRATLDAAGKRAAPLIGRDTK